MSEVGTISNSMSPKELGALAPGCEAKIISDNGKFLGSGEVGEMLVKTPTIMKGKENNNKHTLVLIDFPVFMILLLKVKSVQEACTKCFSVHIPIKI